MDKKPSDYLVDFSADMVYNVSRGLYGPFIGDLLRVMTVILDFATLGESEAPFPPEIDTNTFLRIREILVLECGFQVNEISATGQYLVRWGHIAVDR